MDDCDICSGPNDDPIALTVTSDLDHVALSACRDCTIALFGAMTDRRNQVIEQGNAEVAAMKRLLGINEPGPAEINHKMSFYENSGVPPMTLEEMHDFYNDPANREPAGPPERRRDRMHGGNEPTCPACFGNGEIIKACELCNGSGVDPIDVFRALRVDRGLCVSCNTTKDACDGFRMADGSPCCLSCTHDNEREGVPDG